MASSPHLHLLPLLLLLAVLLAAAGPSSAAEPRVIRLPTERKAARACAAPPDPAVYDLPVIGIVSHPGDGAGGRISNGTATSYIAASYVKFVEAAGARVIPLVYNEPEERILEKLSLVNGVLFTGGSEKHGPYFETIKKVFQDNNILETFDALNQASTLQFSKYSLLEGSVFQRFDPELIKKVSTSCLVMQNHRVYVSTVEAYKYPITCTQWHPEKAIFEWRKPMIPHSEDAVQVTQHFANHFISQARKSPNRPPADKVLNNLIYNYRSTFSGKTSRDGCQDRLFLGTTGDELPELIRATASFPQRLPGTQLLLPRIFGGNAAWMPLVLFRRGTPR
ncbi:hypothetical protein PR202_gb01814 [Eleusine coracana subsp. coracana]|uniref:folate gamma-glutamyl hydrolase n=1 Tax=Eleusine coracana subsp. coracana TaxID=191504 RepID=A0AAV5DXG2_ELECO|nr:hypothetical protein PR202_gb01814 [Eleusine coracana subsp. coracana]